MDYQSQCKFETRRRRGNSLKPTDTHEAGQLSRDDVERRTCHESTDSRRGNKLDEPSKVQQTNAQDDEAAYEGDSGCNLRTVPHIGMCLVDMFDDLGNRERHDCDGTDGHILGGSEELEDPGQ